MFGISGFELLLIAAFALIIFGPDKLPQFGRTAGRFMRDFKRTQEEMEAMMRAEMYEGKKKGAASPGGDSDAAGDMAAMETEPVSRAEEWADDDDEEEDEE